MAERNITAKVQAVETPEGAGARVKRAIPNNLGVVDPFVLLDEFYVNPPAGFPEHPHRGFEIVTYVLEGSFGHRDSMGTDQLVAAGGLQKINAGRGISHSEMPGGSGLSHGLQLWVNLAKKDKGLAPEYQGLQANEVPQRTEPGTETRVIVGPGSPVILHTPVLYLDVTLQPGSKWRQLVPAQFDGFFYVLAGSGKFGADIADGRVGELLVLGEGEEVSAVSEGGQPLRFVLVAGEPHREPIYMRGPYVD
jgi:quercetin 2,3-dioxygenase